MIIDIYTLFPEFFQGPFTSSIIARAQKAQLVDIHIHNIRDAAIDRHKTCDDSPYGGGAGMVLKAEPVFETVEQFYTGGPIIFLAPQGKTFNQKIAEQLSNESRLSFICGHYEGVDERIIQHLATEVISLGDFVLTGGEPAVAVVADAVIRLIPGVLGNETSTADESHTSGLLEYPQYTRPAVFREWAVPAELLSGSHAEIFRWRRRQSLRNTLIRRPDMFTMWRQVNSPLTKEDTKILAELQNEGLIVPDGIL